MRKSNFIKDKQYWKFSFYGFLKNLQFFDPFLVLFFREMGITFFQIGILFSVREIITNITELPTGIAADTLGRRKIMIFAFLCYICSFILFFLFPSYLVYLAAMTMFALGDSFRSGTHKAMIMEYLKLNHMTEHKIAYYGHTRGWAQLGSALSALIAAALVFFSGSFRYVFLGSIIPYIGGMLLIVSYPKQLDFSCDTEDGCEDEKRMSLENIKKTVKDFIALFKHKNTRKAVLNSSLFDAVFKTVKDYVQPVLKTLALALPLLSALEGNQRISVVTGIVYFLLYLLTSWASSHASIFHSIFSSESRGINYTFIAGCFIVASLGAFLVYNFQIAAVILFIGYFVLENLRRPATLGYLSDSIKGSVLATGLSGESQLKSLFVAILAPLTGLIADKAGIGQALLLLGALLIAVYKFVYLKDER